MKTPADHARDSAESVRALNHASLNGGYAQPQDVDAVVAVLRTLVERLPQAIEQAAVWLTTHRSTIATDNGTRPAVAVLDVTSRLTTAAAMAREMAATLAEAQAVTATLKGRD